MKKLFLAIIAIMIVDYTHAQWQPTSGPDCNFVYSIKGKDNYLFASSQIGIFRSGDGGYTWQPANKGLPDTVIFALEVSGDKIFAGTEYHGIYMSTDNGNTWVDANNGLTRNRNVWSLLADGNTLYAGLDFGLFYTDDYGVIWNSLGLPMIDVGSIAKRDNIIVVGSYTVLMTENNGLKWSVINNDLPDDDITAVVFCDSVLFALTANLGLYKSYDLGGHWLTDEVFKFGGISSSYSLFVHDSLIFVGTDYKGVYFSNDMGNSWKDISEGLSYRTIYSLEVIGDYLYAGTYQGGVWKRKLSEIVNGLEENKNTTDKEIYIYPNPLRTIVTITLPTHPNETAEFRLYSITGRLLKKEKFTGQSYQLKRGNLPSGMYLYQITTGGQQFTGKVMVE